MLTEFYKDAEIVSVSTSSTSPSRQVRVWIDRGKRQIIGAIGNGEDILILGVVVAEQMPRHSIAITSVGDNFFICWNNSQNDPRTVNGIWVDGNLNLLQSEFIVSSTEVGGHQFSTRKPSCLGVDSNKVIVAWQANPTGTKPDWPEIHVQIIDLSTEVKGDLHVFKNEHRGSHNPNLLSSEGGDVVLAFERANEVLLQKLDSSGNPISNLVRYGFSEGPNYELSTALMGDFLICGNFFGPAGQDHVLRVTKFNSSDLTFASEHKNIIAPADYKNLWISSSASSDLVAFNIQRRGNNNQILKDVLLWKPTTEETIAFLQDQSSFFNL